jgi:hypothetical protein
MNWIQRETRLLDELQSEVEMDSKMYALTQALRNAESCESLADFKTNVNDALHVAVDIVAHLRDLVERAK